MFCRQMDVQTTAMVTDYASCSATRGYADVEMAGRATTVILLWKLTVTVAAMKTTVCNMTTV